MCRDRELEQIEEFFSLYLKLSIEKKREDNLLKNKRKLLLSISILVLGVSFSMAFVCLYSAAQLRALKGQVVYHKPRERYDGDGIGEIFWYERGGDRELGQRDV